MFDAHCSLIMLEQLLLSSEVNKNGCPTWQLASIAAQTLVTEMLLSSGFSPSLSTQNGLRRSVLLMIVSYHTDDLATCESRSRARMSVL